MTMDWDRIVATLQDRHAVLPDRIDAARMLRDDDRNSTRDALLRIACSDDEHPTLQSIAGEILAHHYARADGLVAAPLSEFSGPAYIGFDSIAARLLNESSRS